METFLSNSRFMEYSATPAGRYFIKAEWKYRNQWITIGYIHRHYDAETKKYTYRATDFQGGPMFTDFKDLYILKKKFIEHGQSLAQSVPQIQRPTEKPVFIPKSERNTELKNIREKKSEKEKVKEVSKTNPKMKINEGLKEKEQDSKNPMKYKDAEQGKEDNHQKGNEQIQETTESVKHIQNETRDNKVSEREDELNQIREQGEDIEEELER